MAGEAAAEDHDAIATGLDDVEPAQGDAVALLQPDTAPPASKQNALLSLSVASAVFVAAGVLSCFRKLVRGGIQKDREALSSVPLCLGVVAAAGASPAWWLGVVVAPHLQERPIAVDCQVFSLADLQQRVVLAVEPVPSSEDVHAGLQLDDHVSGLGQEQRAHDPGAADIVDEQVGGVGRQRCLQNLSGIGGVVTETAGVGAAVHHARCRVGAGRNCVQRGCPGQQGDEAGGSHCCWLV